MASWKSQTTGDPISYDTLQKTYNEVTWGTSEPNRAYMTVGAWRAIQKYFRNTYEDDFDEFTEWVKDVREEAAAKKKTPKPAANAATRKFLDKRYGKRRDVVAAKSKIRR